jgi:hypothetical protein
MQGPSHLMLSWFFADASRLDAANDRRIVAWSGLAPDIDVFAYAGAILWYGLDKDLAFENVWRVVHHRYTHGLAFVLLTGIVAWMAASRFAGSNGAGAIAAHARAWRVALLSMLASALHNFCDIVGGGATWPVYPLWPLSDFGWTANWSWELSEWPNTLILFSCLAATMLYARFAGRSPVELFGGRADRWFAAVVQRGSDRPGGGASPTEEKAHKRVSLRLIIWMLVILVTIAILAPLGFRPGS